MCGASYSFSARLHIILPQKTPCSEFSGGRAASQHNCHHDLLLLNLRRTSSTVSVPIALICSHQSCFPAIILICSNTNNLITVTNDLLCSKKKGLMCSFSITQLSLSSPLSFQTFSTFFANGKISSFLFSFLPFYT